jgi:hypothetical protein
MTAKLWREFVHMESAIQTPMISEFATGKIGESTVAMDVAPETILSKLSQIHY